jgi:uncharacterized SAM-binding protein YcdF (DUF218 family)
MLRLRRLALPALGLVLVFLLALTSWIQWGGWPDPEQKPLFDDADAIVILGGGDISRWQHGADLAKAHPELPLIITGDGGEIVEYVIENGILRERILHEEMATSTAENASFTAPILNQLRARRIIIVTNSFHVPRALAAFDKLQPERDFRASFESKPANPTKWEQKAQRRERMAAIWYLLRYGIWSW